MTNLTKTIKKIDSILELRELNSLIVDRIKSLRRTTNFQSSTEFSIGQTVKINNENIKSNSKLKGAIGKIKKINRTKAVVDFGNIGEWNVPFYLLLKTKEKFNGKKKTGNKCKYCRKPNCSPDPDVLCGDCRETFGHSFYSEL